MVIYSKMESIPLLACLSVGLPVQNMKWKLNSEYPAWGGGAQDVWAA